MNVGEYLVSKSPLNSGTALAHLLAMQTGGVRTVFASQMAVCLEAPKVSVLIKRIDRHVATSVREVETVQRDKSNRINALMRTPRIDALTGNETIYIVQKRANEQVVCSLPNTVFAHRKRETLTVGDSTEMIVCNT